MPWPRQSPPPVPVPSSGRRKTPDPRAGAVAIRRRPVRPGRKYLT